MGVIEASNPMSGVGLGSPRLNAGAPVAGTDNVQTLLFTGTPTGGTFRLKVNGLVSPTITFTTVAATLAARIVAALENIVGTGNVACTSSVTVPAITFQVGAGKQVINKIIIAAQALTGGSTPFVAVKQVIRFTGTPDGGTFKLTINGQTTGAITYSTTDATLAANIVAGLEALSGVGSGNTAVSSASTGTVVTVGFVQAPAGVVDFGLMTLGDNSLTGGTAPTFTVDTTTPGVEATGRTVPAGGLLNDTTNKLLYQNSGTQGAPTWTKVGAET